MVKKGRIIIFFLLVLLLGGLIGTTTTGVTNDIKLGLDLQGGFEVLYEVLPAEDGDVITQDILISTVKALEKRVNVLGVSEPRIDIEGDNRIRVQLAGVDDQNKAREILSTEAKLTFRDVNDVELLDGADLVEGGASQTFDQNNKPIVAITLKSAEEFAKVTKHVLDLAPQNLMPIWLDYEEGDSFSEESLKETPKYLSAPSVGEVFNTTSVTITGDFTIEEAKELADLLNAGSLPVELKEMYSTSVGAQFGEQALQKTVFAGIIGILLVFVYMLMFYRFPGVIAVITLSVYIYLVLLVFDWMNGVLTLPGIAALILGVGMAVDANIITYERIKEELKTGKSVMSAYKAGNRRSLATILDANITTLLAAGVLFVYGTSSVKGFATMLIVSILLSFITAIWGTRLFLGLWVNSRFLNKKVSYFGVKEADIQNIETGETDYYIPTRFDKFDFVKHRKKYFMFSGAMVVIGAILLLTLKLNLGIDFASGTRVEVMSNETLTVEEVEAEIAALDFEIEPRDITLSGDQNEIAVLRFLDTFTEDEVAMLKSHFIDTYGAEPNVSTVSPTVGKELAKNAFISVLIASIGIIIYVTIRFEIYMAIAAIVALLHDAFFIIAFFSLLRLEVDLTFIAAVLTIVGYSINDTIVTFDRIREIMKIRGKKVKTFDDLASVVNDSLRQTLGRSVSTIFTVVIVTVALLLLGSSAITNFSLALLVGLIAGTYSSLFIAAQLWLIWKSKTLGKKKARPVEEDLEP
ncbi:SecD/SecF fusion protein [Bacillus mesophilus]|uniref:Multifunctional fusion protein n=1 Tax=Bacillus mesophilus TaxID=1808955 RepID=A0A6M0Q8C8_9BACI|nr:protein translocase subunit SecDF [Bacillus mesophilus]MBM7660693.1 SecD/SecF fusion protein [Bacillus mesophilus]NEY71760.1 protein translocase subunit SecDF [Bacillus mesophilus]